MKNINIEFGENVRTVIKWILAITFTAIMVIHFNNPWYLFLLLLSY
jgi:hypothetical protein